MAFQLSRLGGDPVGTIIDWLRATSAVPVPTNWMICDGTTVSDPASTWNGIALPDLRGKFLRGHDTITNATFGAATTYHAGGAGVQAGGSDTHVHGAGSHTHTGGSHSHTLNGSTYAYNTFSEGGETEVQFGTGSFVPSSSHQHRNNGGTTADSAGPTGGASGVVDAADGKPAFTGLLKIIKIK